MFRNRFIHSTSIRLKFLNHYQQRTQNQSILFMREANRSKKSHLTASNLSNRLEWILNKKRAQIQRTASMKKPRVQNNGLNWLRNFHAWVNLTWTRKLTRNFLGFKWKITKANFRKPHPPLFELGETTKVSPVFLEDIRKSCKSLSDISLTRISSNLVRL
jgi:hypothetical protein